MNSSKLVVLSALKAKRVSSFNSSKLILTQKLIDGALEYQKYWPGQVVLLVEEDVNLSSNLDNVMVDVNELPFQVDIIDLERVQDNQVFQGSAVVLASSDDFRQNQVSEICKQLKIPCIYGTEYSLKTRIQIINTTTKNPVVRLRGYLKTRRRVSKASCQAP